MWGDALGTRYVTLHLSRTLSAVSASSARDLSRQWVNRLAAYRLHRHNEHIEALVDEAVRFAGLQLENDLSHSDYWSKAPLARRVAVLLFLVDRGAVNRLVANGRRVYEPTEAAEKWVKSQSSLAPYLEPTLELISALRGDQSRRASASRS